MLPTRSARPARRGGCPCYASNNAHVVPGAPMNTALHEVGRVVALWRYPVKSMAAEPLETGDVAWHGFAGDRRWAFIRGGVERSGFPWLTIRERPELRHYRPSFSDPERVAASSVLVRTPDRKSVV